jgi:hypothetical protein
MAIKKSWLFTPPVFVPVHQLDVDYATDPIDESKTDIIWVNSADIKAMRRFTDRTYCAMRNSVAVLYIIETPEEVLKLIAACVAANYPDQRWISYIPPAAPLKD